MSRARHLLLGGILVALLAMLAVAIGRQRALNAALRQQVETLRHTEADTRRWRTENVRLSAALTAKAGTAAPALAPGELERARQEVAALERLIAQQQRVAAAAPFEENRDPERGMVPPEHFRNVGRTTPAKAFQTAVWAAAEANFDALAQVLALSQRGRAEAQAYLDRQPPETRRRFPTPEHVLAVVTADLLGEQEGWQIGETKTADEIHATLLVRHLKLGSVQREQPLPFERDAAGWRLSVPDAAVAELADAIASASLRVSKRAAHP